MALRIDDYAELQALAQVRMPRVAFILGSGLSDLADHLLDAVELPFEAAPDLEASSVPGHRGVLLLGRWTGIPVLVFAGRLHHYEGHAWDRVVRPVQMARELGASILIATNAAGGIRDDLNSGDLLALQGHLDCTTPTWWRDLDLSRQSCCSSRLLDLLPLPRGVYAQVTGPCYETPAEIRALRTCRADAVGMSTGRELAAAHALGMECAAISCITNKAAGLGDGPLHHDEVLAVGRNVKSKLIAVLEALLRETSLTSERPRN
jgi:purine-nucleoside phosphorylase